MDLADQADGKGTAQPSSDEPPMLPRYLGVIVCEIAVVAALWALGRLFQ